MTGVNTTGIDTSVGLGTAIGGFSWGRLTNIIDLVILFQLELQVKFITLVFQVIQQSREEILDLETVVL